MYHIDTRSNNFLADTIQNKIAHGHVFGRYLACRVSRRRDADQEIGEGESQFVRSVSAVQSFQQAARHHPKPERAHRASQGAAGNKVGFFVNRLTHRIM